MTADGLLAVNPSSFCASRKNVERLKYPGAAMLRKRKPWQPWNSVVLLATLPRKRRRRPSSPVSMELDFSVTGATFLSTPTSNIRPQNNCLKSTDRRQR